MRIEGQELRVKSLMMACFFLLGCTSLVYAESYGMLSAERPFLEGNYDKAVKETDRLIGSDADRKDELYYIKGLSQLKLGRFAEARRTFEELLSKYPGSSRSFDAKVGIGDSFYLDGNSSAASSIYSDIIQKYSANPNIESVRKRLSDCGPSYRPQPAVQTDQGPAAQPAVSRPGSQERFSVQVGSFKSKKNAEGLAKKLSSKGYASYVDMPDTGGDKMYRVKVGRSLSDEEARKLEGKLKVRGYPTRICPEN